MAQRLTDATIKRLNPPTKGNRIAYDSDAPGFGIRVTAAGAKAFVFNYRVRGSGRERRYTIGGFPAWLTTAARSQAKELRRQVDNGGDPLGAIEAERAAPTVSDLCDRFEEEHLPRKRPGTAEDYRRMLRVHIRPFFGAHVKVADVRFADIDRLHRKITATGHLHRANRVIAVLSKMFSLACRWAMRTDNPCRGIERNYEGKRRRYLAADELARLIKALNEYPDQQTANIFRVLLLTGCRRGEALNMRWAELDLTEGVWTKPGSTTKQRTDHVVPLSAPVRVLLSEIREDQARKHPKQPLGEFVFPGTGNSSHVVSLKRAWRALCRAASIEGARIHDLRHSFASHLVSGGASLPLIGALLGHSDPATTHRYSHLYDEPQRAATERVGAVIAAAGQPGAEVTKLSRRR